jgi:hypothetical protein
MKAGVLIGLSSGSGNAAKSLNSLAKALMSFETALCRGLFEDFPIPSGWTVLNIVPQNDYLARLRASVKVLLSWGADVLVCVGGDGLASYAADAMRSCGCRIPMLGVAAGTINVGPIIAFQTEDLENMHGSLLEDLAKFACPVDAIEVSVDGKHLAFGFNDVVIGNTFLGTLHGKITNLSVRAMIEQDSKQPEEPSSEIVTDSFEIRKNNSIIPCMIRKPAQIIASPLKKREFYGRAIAGVLCNAAFMKSPAALAVSDTILVRAAKPHKGFQEFARVEHLLFEEGDVVELSGFKESGQIIADGNPFLRSGMVIGLEVRSAVVDVVHPPIGPGGF